MLVVPETPEVAEIDFVVGGLLDGCFDGTLSVAEFRDPGQERQLAVSLGGSIVF